MPLLEVANLSKDFRVRKRQPGVWGSLRSLVASDWEIRHAVRDVSFEAERGEIVGYLGPNGAGKSTTIKMLVGILQPTTGHASVCGFDPQRERAAVAQRIGIVFGQRTNLWWDLPLIESFRLLRHIYRIPENHYYASLDRLTEVLDMGSFLDMPVRLLSLGQKMRGDLAAALLHEPQILFLDEPTVGLDIVGKEQVREFILAMNRERGLTVLLTTHDLHDVERLCQRVIIIDRGSAIYDGSLARLLESYAPYRTLVLDLLDGAVGRSDLVAALRDFPRPQEAGAAPAIVQEEGNRFFIRFEPRSVAAPRLLSHLSERVALRDLAIEEPDIEEVVARIYREGM